MPVDLFRPHRPPSPSPFRPPQPRPPSSPSPFPHRPAPAPPIGPGDLARGGLAAGRRFPLLGGALLAGAVVWWAYNWLNPPESPSKPVVPGDGWLDAVYIYREITGYHAPRGFWEPILSAETKTWFEAISPFTADQPAIHWVIEKVGGVDGSNARWVIGVRRWNSDGVATDTRTAPEPYYIDPNRCTVDIRLVVRYASGGDPVPSPYPGVWPDAAPGPFEPARRPTVRPAIRPERPHFPVPAPRPAPRPAPAPAPRPFPASSPAPAPRPAPAPSPGPGPLPEPVRPTPAPRPAPAPAPAPFPVPRPVPAPAPAPAPFPAPAPAPPAPAPRPVPAPAPRPALPGQPVNPDGTVGRPVSDPAVGRTDPNTHVVGRDLVGDPSIRPRPDLLSMSVELGRVEQKLALLLLRQVGGGGGGGQGSDRTGEVLAKLEQLRGELDGLAKRPERMVGPVRVRSEAPADFNPDGSRKAFVFDIPRLPASAFEALFLQRLLEFLHVQKTWRNHVAKVGTSGEPVTITWQEVPALE